MSHLHAYAQPSEWLEEHQSRADLLASELPVWEVSESFFGHRRRRHRSLFFSSLATESYQGAPREVICPAAGASTSRCGAGRVAKAKEQLLCLPQLDVLCSKQRVLDEARHVGIWILQLSSSSETNQGTDSPFRPRGNSLKAEDRRGQQAEESLEKRGLFRNTVNSPAAAAIVFPSFLLSEIIFFSNSLSPTPMPARAGRCSTAPAEKQACA